MPELDLYLLGALVGVDLWSVEFGFASPGNEDGVEYLVASAL